MLSLLFQVPIFEASIDQCDILSTLFPEKALCSIRFPQTNMRCSDSMRKLCFQHVLQKSNFYRSDQYFSVTIWNACVCKKCLHCNLYQLHCSSVYLETNCHKDITRLHVWYTCRQSQTTSVIYAVLWDQIFCQAIFIGMNNKLPSVFKTFWTLQTKTSQILWNLLFLWTWNFSVFWKRVHELVIFTCIVFMMYSCIWFCWKIFMA